MDIYNVEYMNDVQTIHKADNSFDIEKSIKNLIQLRNNLLYHHPEYMDSIIDIDFIIACAAYRINDVQLLESTIQKHYYADYRFKKLYQAFYAVETANVFKDIVHKNAHNMEKTFVRSLSVIILTGICLSFILRQ